MTRAARAQDGYPVDAHTRYVTYVMTTFSSGIVLDMSAQRTITGIPPSLGHLQYKTETITFHLGNLIYKVLKRSFKYKTKEIDLNNLYLFIK